MNVDKAMELIENLSPDTKGKLIDLLYIIRRNDVEFLERLLIKAIYLERAMYKLKENAG